MYVVKQRYSDTFEIAHFDNRKEPVGVYTIRGNKCSCPARNPCKHQGIVTLFKELEPGVWGFELINNIVQPYYLSLFHID